MVDDGTAKFSVKTVCAKEYVDAKIKELTNYNSIKAISINNVVGTAYIQNICCYKVGHVVFVNFEITKADEAGKDTSRVILAGFPKPINDVWIHVAPLNSVTLLRGRLRPNGEFGWHYINAWQTSAGHEAVAQFTYLTNE